jgi:hypothetical protein
MRVPLGYLLSFGLVGLSNSFQIQSCRTSNDGKAIGGCNCAYTNPGIYCPANFYCPEYSDDDISTYSSSLMAASCTYQPSSGSKPPRVECPCTPGNTNIYLRSIQILFWKLNLNFGNRNIYRFFLS